MPEHATKSSVDDLSASTTSGFSGKADTSHTHAGVYEPANANIQAHVASAHAPSNAQKNSDITLAEIEAKLVGQISSHSHAGGSEAFPVGSVFLSAVATNPATLLGYGTWSAIGAGRCIVGQDAGDADFDTLLETGGAKTVTLTTAEMPSHTHLQQRHATTTGALTGPTTAPDTSSSSPQSWGVATQATGGGGAHANVQPYIVLKIWQRTA